MLSQLKQLALSSMNADVLFRFQQNVAVAVAAAANAPEALNAPNPQMLLEGPIVQQQQPIIRRNYCKLTDDQMAVVLRMRQDGQSYLAIKTFCNRTWIVNASIAGLAAAIQRVHVRGLLRIHSGGRRAALSQAQRDHIVELQLTHSNWTYQMISDETTRHFQIQCSRAAVARLIQNEDFTDKTTTNCSRSSQLRCKYRRTSSLCSQRNALER